jgi:hypothetical protein
MKSTKAETGRFEVTADDGLAELLYDPGQDPAPEPR